MTQRRLTVLLAILGALVLLRIFVPPRAAPAPGVVAEAVVRPRTLTIASAQDAAPGAGDEVKVESQLKEDVPGNAFSVRTPAAPVNAAPPAPVVAINVPVPALPVGPIVNLSPAPPPPPFQVIGTWDDGKEPGVFLSSTSGVLLARQGTILQAEYKVVGLTAQQISMVQIASKREFTLPVSRPVASPSPQNIP